MADNVIFEYLSTFSGKSKFAEICLAEITAAQNEYRGGIGTLGEKRMHRIIKRAITDDTSQHEVKIADALMADGLTPTRIPKRTVADVFRNGEIFEVQTGGFRPLHDKLLWLLENTPYEMSLIHPLASHKTLFRINSETYEIRTTGKYRKFENTKSIAKELYWIREIVSNPAYRERFRLVLMLLKVSDYKICDDWSHNGRHGASKYERIPTELEDIIVLKNPQDYVSHFLPDELPCRFTASEYGKLVKIKGMALYSILDFLVCIGALSLGEKLGRCKTWLKVCKGN